MLQPLLVALGYDVDHDSKQQVRKNKSEDASQSFHHVPGGLESSKTGEFSLLGIVGEQQKTIEAAISNLTMRCH